MAIATRPFALPLTDEEREWMEAQEYAQTHTPAEMLNNGVRAISESVASGEFDAEKADLYLRVLMAEYVAVIATEQINGYMERQFGPWLSRQPALGRQRSHKR